jgi:uncharacterized protein
VACETHAKADEPWLVFSPTTTYQPTLKYYPSLILFFLYLRNPKIFIIMSLELKINDAIKEAMKAKAEGKLRALRGIKSAIILAKTEKGGNGELAEDKEIPMLQKLHKQRKESYDIFVAQNRPDLADKEKEEMDVIESFLPQQISDEELTAIIQKIITDNNATSIKDMGKVMGASNAALAGKADGQRISMMVKTLLNP